MSALQAVKTSETVQPGISLTLGECVLAVEALARLASQPAPPKTAYRIAKLLKLATEEAKEYHKLRDDLITELGDMRATTPAERAQGGGAEIKEVPVGKRAEFYTRMKDVEAVPAMLAWRPLTPEDIDTLARVNAEDLVRLGPCFMDNEQEVS